jgi:hypothetical protein
MANIWNNEANGEWQVVPLPERASLTRAGQLVALARHSPATETGERSVLVQQVSAGHGAGWALVADGDDVSVNGSPLYLGIRLLQDRDEVLVRDTRTNTVRQYFFSTEELAHVETFRAASKAVCPRCKDALTPGQPGVRCPLCRVWHHQDGGAQRPCWTYGERCAACDKQLTALDAGFRWTPEEL